MTQMGRTGSTMPGTGQTLRLAQTLRTLHADAARVPCVNDPVSHFEPIRPAGFAIVKRGLHGVRPVSPAATVHFGDVRPDRSQTGWVPSAPSHAGGLRGRHQMLTAGL